MTQSKKRGVYSEIAVGLASGILLSANNNRRSLAVGNPTANTIWIAFGRAATASQSYPIYPSTSTVLFDWDKFGTLLQQDIYAITTVAPGFAAVLAGED